MFWVKRIRTWVRSLVGLTCKFVGVRTKVSNGASSGNLLADLSRSRRSSCIACPSAVGAPVDHEMSEPGGVVRSSCESVRFNPELRSPGDKTGMAISVVTSGSNSADRIDSVYVVAKLDTDTDDGVAGADCGDAI